MHASSISLESSKNSVTSYPSFACSFTSYSHSPPLPSHSPPGFLPPSLPILHLCLSLSTSPHSPVLSPLPLLHLLPLLRHSFSTSSFSFSTSSPLSLSLSPSSPLPLLHHLPLLFSLHNFCPSFTYPAFTSYSFSTPPSSFSTFITSSISFTTSSHFFSTSSPPSLLPPLPHLLPLLHLFPLLQPPFSTSSHSICTSIYSFSTSSLLSLPLPPFITSCPSPLTPPPLHDPFLSFSHSPPSHPLTPPSLLLHYSHLNSPLLPLHSPLVYHFPHRFHLLRFFSSISTFPFSSSLPPPLPFPPSPLLHSLPLLVHLLPFHYVFLSSTYSPHSIPLFSCTFSSSSPGLPPSSPLLLYPFLRINHSFSTSTFSTSSPLSLSHFSSSPLAPPP